MISNIILIISLFLVGCGTIHKPSRYVAKSTKPKSQVYIDQIQETNILTFDNTMSDVMYFVELYKEKKSLKAQESKLFFLVKVKQFDNLSSVAEVIYADCQKIQDRELVMVLVNHRNWAPLKFSEKRALVFNQINQCRTTTLKYKDLI